MPDHSNPHREEEGLLDHQPHDPRKWFIGLLVLVVASLVACYFWFPEIFGAAILVFLALGAVSFMAYMTPMSDSRHQLSRNTLIVVTITFVIGLVIGTFPSLALFGNYVFWDKIVPGGVSSVFPSDKDPPKTVTITNDVLEVADEVPPGYKLQVKYLDAAEKPQFEIVERGRSMQLPLNTSGAWARWIKGGRVTEWTEATIVASATK